MSPLGVSGPAMRFPGCRRALPTSGPGRRGPVGCGGGRSRNLDDGENDRADPGPDGDATRLGTRPRRRPHAGLAACDATSCGLPRLRDLCPDPGPLTEATKRHPGKEAAAPGPAGSRRLRGGTHSPSPQIPGLREIRALIPFPRGNQRVQAWGHLYLIRLSPHTRIDPSNCHFFFKRISQRGTCPTNEHADG
jgi:hypothetical protein